MIKNEIKKMVEQVVGTEYIAEDGTVFYNEEECRKYEESALFTVSKKVKKLNRISQIGLFDLGYDEDYIDIFSVETEEDLDNLKRYLYLKLMENGISKEGAEREVSSLKITSGHEVLIFWGYEEDCLWAYGDGSLDGYFGYVKDKYKKIIASDETENKEEK